MKSPPKTSLWHDEYHYIRAATVKDRHPMRFVVCAIDAKLSPMKARHVPSLTDGMVLASEMSAKLRTVAGDAGDAAAVTSDVGAGQDGAVLELDQRSNQLAAGEAVNSQRGAVPVSAQRRRGRPKRDAAPAPAKLPDWSNVRFNCIRANSVAQVWACVKHAGTAKIGRRSKAGGAPKETALPHQRGDFAVTKHGEPVRNEDGSIRVFASVVAAEDHANWLYWTADEDDRFPLDKSKVWATPNIDILFNPVDNTLSKPFSLWMPFYNKPVFANRTVAHGVSYAHSIEQLRKGGMSEQMLILTEQSRAREKALAREPAFSSDPLLYRSIEGAIAAALDIERETFKGRFLGFAGQGVAA